MPTKLEMFGSGANLDDPDETVLADEDSNSQDDDDEEDSVEESSIDLGESLLHLAAQLSDKRKEKELQNHKRASEAGSTDSLYLERSATCNQQMKKANDTSQAFPAGKIEANSGPFEGKMQGLDAARSRCVNNDRSINQQPATHGSRCRVNATCVDESFLQDEATSSYDSSLHDESTEPRKASVLSVDPDQCNTGRSPTADKSIFMKDMLSKYSSKAQHDVETSITDEDPLTAQETAKTLACNVAKGSSRLLDRRRGFRAVEALQDRRSGASMNTSAEGCHQFEPVSFVKQPGKFGLEYRVRHANRVSKILRDFEESHPGRLKNYSIMQTARKKEELGKVTKLLACLKIDVLPRPKRFPLLSDDEGCTAEKNHPNTAVGTDQSNNLSLPIELDDDEDDLNGDVHPDSMTNLSSRDHDNETDNTDACPMELMRRAGRDFSSVSHTSFDSPDNSRNSTTQRKLKRCQSSSGKRGCDVFRYRLSDDRVLSLSSRSNCRTKATDSPLLPSPASTGLPVFEASQSPIMYQPTYPSYGEDDEDDSPQRGHDLPSNKTDLESMDTADCTFVNNRRAQFEGDVSYLTEIPANVRMKDGEDFRMKPLQVECTFKRSRAPAPDMTTTNSSNFPDPFESYSVRVRRKLQRLHADLAQLDDTANTMNGKAIVFSLTKQQIRDVVVKLLLSSRHDLLNDTYEQVVMKGTPKGRTLIVGRNKEDLASWEQALRVGTSHTVLNHTALSIGDRSRVSTTRKISHHDVILTTFDALISKDVTVPVDENCHAVQHNHESQNGWMVARGSSSQQVYSANQCEKLSILHLMEWRRICFVDMLGRKCYVAKSGTRRSASSIALNSEARFVLFEKQPDSLLPPMDQLAKSDRKAFESVAAVLHLGNDDEQRHPRRSNESKLEDWVLDLTSMHSG